MGACACTYTHSHTECLSTVLQNCSWITPLLRPKPQGQLDAIFSRSANGPFDVDVGRLSCPHLIALRASSCTSRWHTHCACAVLSHVELFFSFFFTLLHMCVCARGMFVSHHVYGGQRTTCRCRPVPPLPPHGPWGFNSGHDAWQQGP